MGVHDKRYARVLIPHHRGELQDLIFRGPQPTWPEVTETAEVSGPLCAPGFAVAAVIIGIYGEACAGQRACKGVVAFGVLAYAVRDLHDTGRPLGSGVLSVPAIAKDLDAARVDKAELTGTRGFSPVCGGCFATHESILPCRASRGTHYVEHATSLPNWFRLEGGRPNTRHVIATLKSMTELIVSLPSDPGLREALGETPGVSLVTWDLDCPAPGDHFDVVVPPYWGGNRQLAQLAGVEVQLVQWQSIGYNGVTRYLPEGIPFANAATVHEASTAELALALTLASQRGLGDFMRDAQAHRWDLRTFPSLADRRVLLVGYGGVSKAIEARLAGFEVEIARLARTARETQNLAGETVAVHGLDELHASLAWADIVIIAVPLTESTKGLFDAAALAAMPDGALLVNVARGPVIVTEALVAELSTGRLRAALDVVDPEPLPAHHPLWDCPGIIITPHAGGDSTAMLPRMVALIRRQIAHLRAGEAPENLVMGAWRGCSVPERGTDPAPSRRAPGAPTCRSAS